MNTFDKVIFCLGGVSLVIFLESYTNMDYIVQDMIYSNGWPITDRYHQMLSPIFYKGIKVFLAFFGTACITALFIKRFKAYRKGLVIVILSIIFVPLTVAGSKQFTNTYCPSQTERYGGPYPNIKLLEGPPDLNILQELPKGKCFPAGHATSGFALMSLGFLFLRKRNRILGLVAGVCLGWVTGIYQQLRGEHYISHTMTSMLCSLLIIIIISEAADFITKYHGSTATVILEKRK